MTSTCLVTGGAGFIGCALSSVLPDHFDRVVAMDTLHPQIHPRAVRPSGLDARVELVHGDVTQAADWDSLLAEVSPTAIVHLAAETGTGQSLTAATRHGAVNVVGTTAMLDALVRHDKLPERIVLASTRAVYGEGAWSDAAGATSYPGQRTQEMLAAGQWDFPGLTPTPFESTRVTANPTSVYGSTKLAQEHVLRSWCLAMKVTPVVFRLQNVYGPGQSLTNPYTGVMSFFVQRAKAGEAIEVYEDGDIVRDFVYIDDAVAAIIEGLRRSEASPHAYDIGSGETTSILALAKLVAETYAAPEPVITGSFRNGDVRHASCDISAASAALGWKPETMLREGIAHLCAWIDEELA